jgi:hypothetical protein
MNQSPSANRIPVAPPGNDDRALTVWHGSEGLRSQIATWAAKQPDTPDFPEAVERLVRLGLAKRLNRRTRRTSRSSTPSTMAAHELDRQEDTSATVDERSDRKKRLIEGPEEFRRSRVDQRAATKALP